MRDEELKTVIEAVIAQTRPPFLRAEIEIYQSAPKVLNVGRHGDVRHHVVYQAATPNRRVYDWTFVVLGKGSTRTIGYQDGNRNAEATFRRINEEGTPSQQEGITISRDFLGERERGFIQAPIPIHSHHVGLRHLYEALPTAKRLEDSRVLDRACRTYLFENVGPSGKGQVAVYHLDKETSIPLKFEMFRDHQNRVDGLPVRVWEAKSLDRLAGRLFPSISSETSYVVQDGAGKARVAVPNIVSEAHVRRLDQGWEGEAPVFWPDYQPGAVVKDLILRKTYQVPGAVPESQETKVVASQEQGQPIRGVERGPLEHWPWAVGGLSACLLIVAIAWELVRRTSG